MKLTTSLPLILLLVSGLLLRVEEAESSLFKKLKDKVIKFVKGRKSGAESSVFYLPPGIQFPGKDEDKLKKVRDLWQEYYGCLSRQLASLGDLLAVSPKVVTVFEGTSARMECRPCVSPDRTGEEDGGITWLYHGVNGTQEGEPVELGEHVLVSPQDRSLLLYETTPDEAGHYSCVYDGRVAEYYVLEVAGSEEPTIMVTPDSAPRGLHSEPSKSLPELRVEVLTSWGPWSPCSRCGAVGKRRRYGVCTVRPLNATTTTTKGPDLLHVAQGGLPCRSRLLPQAIRSHRRVANRRSEIMTQYCKVACPGRVLFEEFDADGKLVDVADNSAGVYSEDQTVPPPEPEVARTTVYQDTLAKIVVLKCPGNLNQDTPDEWQIGSKRVNPVLVKKQTMGRIYVNSRGNLVVRNPLVADSALYSCWEGDELAGTVRLVVTEKTDLSFTHHFMMVGLIVVLGSLLLVFWKAFLAREDATAARSGTSRNVALAKARK